MKYALKEWNTIVEALGKGKTIAIWRKGGIADTPEPNKSFKVEKERFILFPTFTHEELDKVKKECWIYFKQNHKLSKDNQLQIKYWTELYEEIPISDINQLLSISDELVNSYEHLVSSYNLNPSSKGKVLILRVYALNYPILIPDISKYGGCKSWVELNINIPRIRSTPALSFKEFNHKVKTIKLLLAKSKAYTDQSEITAISKAS